MNQIEKENKKINDDYICCDQCFVNVECIVDNYQECNEFICSEKSDICCYRSSGGDACNNTSIRMRAMMNEIYLVLEKSCELRRQLKQLANEEII